MAQEHGPDDDPRSFARQLAAYGGVGTMFPVAIVFGFLGGYYLDGKLGTGPWLALLGFALGVVAALRNLLRAAAALERREREQQQRNNDLASGQRQERRSTKSGRDDE